MTKKALLIGINYRGTSSQLNGCINDVENMKHYLTSKGYTDITTLTDDTPLQPTKSNIIISLLNLFLSGASELFLHYSGHGSWELDRSGDEEDRRDESICPIDCATAGMITDDQLRGLLTFVPHTSKLTIILDCCHSGTGMDLTYNLKSIKSRVRKRVGYRWMWVTEILEDMKRDYRQNVTSGHVVMLSGCMDKQYSADAWEENKFQGALTFCLLKVLNDNQTLTWRQMIDKVREELKSRNYEQIPMFSSGRYLSLDDTMDFA